MSPPEVAQLTFVALREEAHPPRVVKQVLRERHGLLSEVVCQSRVGEGLVVEIVDANVREWFWPARGGGPAKDTLVAGRERRAEPYCPPVDRGVKVVVASIKRVPVMVVRVEVLRGEGCGLGG